MLRDGEQIARAMSDARGRFEVDAPATHVRLDVRAEGFETTTWEGQAAAASALDITLTPIVRIVTTEISGTLAACLRLSGCFPNSPYPRQIIHPVPIHRPGRVEVSLHVRPFADHESISVELRGCPAERRVTKRNNYWWNTRNPPLVLAVDVRGGCMYEVRVFDYDGWYFEHGRYEGIVTHPY